jgi:glycosyltransferase involved in cell wall biosynthesis
LKFLDRLIVGNLVFPFCKRIIGWDANILDYLHDVHGNRFADQEVIVIYGVNGDAGIFLEHQHEYNLHGQILCVGAVIEQRDYVPMIRAFHSITAEFPMVRLKVVGHIYYDRAVRLAAELGLGERVQFVGEQPHDLVLEELKRSDLFFASLSGKYLGMGTATLESMLMGVPTLCNVTEDHLGGPVLKDLEQIVLTKGLDPQFIAARLRLLLSDRDLRRHIGTAGRTFVAENMSWEKVGEDMERMLNTVLQKA